MFANLGLPMLCVGLPWMVILLLPIILIEAGWYWRFLHVPWSQAKAKSVSANFLSTFVGLPLALVLWSMISIMSMGIPYHQYAGIAPWLTLLLFVAKAAYWQPLLIGGEIAILGSILVLLLPAFFISYLLEARHLRNSWPQIKPEEVNRQVWNAHLLTYGLLYLLAGIPFFYAAYLSEITLRH